MPVWSAHAVSMDNLSTEMFLQLFWHESSVCVWDKTMHCHLPKLTTVVFTLQVARQVVCGRASRGQGEYVAFVTCRS
jgi:hypothetical protein